MIDFFLDYFSVILFVSVIVTLFSGFPIAYTIGGTSTLFAIFAMNYGMFSWIEFFNVAQRIWVGTVENVLLIAVSAYVLMGAILQESGAARYLLRTMDFVLGRIPGSMALSVVAMGVVLAATTGIIGASVMILTLLALPELLNRGYYATLSAGVIAASATLGILIPPSIMLVIMGDMLAISVGELFFGALIPGLVLAALYMIYVVSVSFLSGDLRRRLKAAAASEKDAELKGAEAVRVVLLGLVAPATLIFSVLGSIFFGLATPTESAGMGVFGAILLSAAYGSLSWEMLYRSVQSTMRMVGMIFLLIFGASTFAYMFRTFGGDDLIIRAIETAGLGNWSVLIILLTVIFVLGFVLDWMEILFIMIPILYPIFRILDFDGHVSQGYSTYWIAILIAVCLQTSFLTPPVGFALFYLKSAAGKLVTLKEIYRGIVPFVLLQLFGLIAIIAFPSIVTWLPSYMLK